MHLKLKVQEFCIEIRTFVLVLFGSDFRLNPTFILIDFAMKNRTKIIIGAVIVLLIGGLVYMYLNMRTKDATISEMSQQFKLEKDELTDEYSQLNLQYEGYGLRVGNDSLATLVESERVKIQQVLAELKTVKVTNARRIGQLKKELESMRGVMRQYVIQIDSLNAQNSQLRSENKVVTKRWNDAQQQANTLSEEKNVLTKKVTLASILEARSISVESLTNKGRIAKKISKTSQLKFSFIITKNISAPTGEKYVYLRVLQPDGAPLIKKNEDQFLFENKYINYSARRPIDYEGDEVAVTIYWDVEEFLHPGSYRADIFADGYVIGSVNFSLKN